MDYQHDLEQCHLALTSGKPILYPTDTIWGLGCDAKNEQAVDSVIQLKRRPEEKSLIVLLASTEALEEFTGPIEGYVLMRIQQFKEPTTVIFPKGKNLAVSILAKDGSIGIRIVKDPFCKALIELLGGPLVSTSANLSGHVTPKNFDDIDAEIISGAGFVVNHRRDDRTPKSPSRILKLLEDGTFVQLR